MQNERGSFFTDCQIPVVLSTVTTFGVIGTGVIFEWPDATRAGLLSGLFVLVIVTWTLAYPRLRFPHVQLREALQRLEQATSLDLDGDGHVGVPETEPERPIVISGSVREPTSFEEDLSYFVREWIGGRRSWREWNGRKSGWSPAHFPSERAVEQVYWERLNAVLIEAGVARRGALGTLVPVAGMTHGKAHRLAFDALRRSPTLTGEG
jgi:hypothetical protein